MRMSKSLLKSIRFNLEDEADRELYEWLARLPRGEFSNKTKQFWLDKMKEEQK
jgi:hypothetical protein